MALARVRFTVVATCLTMLAASGASAQVFGTFSWQMQPFCNLVTMTITQVPSGFTIDGFDEQCGAVKRASAIGMALINPDGTVGLEFTIVAAPSGRAAHVSASINPGTGSGTWTDSVGNSGAFVLAGAVPGLPARPMPASGVGPATITALEIAPAAVGASEIGSGAVGAAELAFGAVRSSHLGVITERQGVSTVIAAGANGSATATCNPGEEVLSAGNLTSSSADVFITAARRFSTNSWVVFAHNSGVVSRSITAIVYCLAP